MFTKLRTAVIAVALLASLFLSAGVVSASPVAGCGGVQQAWIGQSQLYASGVLSGVDAYINPDTGFKHCDTGGSSCCGAASVWVAIGAATCSGCQLGNAVVQIGVVNCNEGANSSSAPCWRFHPPGWEASTTHFFFAYGGCNNVGPTAQPVSFTGDATAQHHFNITETSNAMDLFIDGTLVYVLSRYGSSIACWLAPANVGATHAVYEGETHIYGDGIGVSGGGTTVQNPLARVSNVWSSLYPTCNQAGGSHLFCSRDSTHLYLATYY